MKVIPEGPNISMKDAHNRHKNKQCLNCGQPKTNEELESCNKPACRKALKPIYRWATHVAGYFPEETVYVGNVGN